MRLPSKAIANQYIRALIKRHHVLRHCIEIDGINRRAASLVKAQSERNHIPMRLVYEPDLCVSDRQLISRNPPVDDRRVETGAGERIAETVPQRFEYMGSSVNRHWSLALRNRAELVDAVAMVGVIVGNHDGIYPSDAGRQQL